MSPKSLLPKIHRFKELADGHLWGGAQVSISSAIATNLSEPSSNYTARKKWGEIFVCLLICLVACLLVFNALFQSFSVQ